jgi:alkanesulfonate monooxygenase SsuD/methylene tetrahydromethanopterin reductase-like flavin-dependent oxidoreductase (luciferase family)
VVPAQPRHPLALAGQARLIEELAPGRLRLGIGPSHRPMIEGIYGLSYEQPLRYVREYVQVLRAALWDGHVDHDGDTFHVHTDVAEPTRTPILLSALGPRSFLQAGEISDGAISWMCPLPYLHDVARPKMVEGAARANREVPPLIAHVLVAMSADEAVVVSAVEQRVAFYASLPAYAAAFAAAGYEITDEASVHRLALELVVSGDEQAVRDRLRRVLDSGIDEVAAHLVVVTDQEAETRSLHGTIAALESRAK